MMDERRYLYAEAVVYGNRELDYLNTPIFRMDIESAATFRVTETFAFRPDLISYRCYNSWHLGWLIMDYNDILDPFEELVVGKVLRIPGIQDYFSFFNRYSR